MHEYFLHNAIAGASNAQEDLTLGETPPQNVDLLNYDLDVDSVLGRSIDTSLLGLLTSNPGRVLEFTMSAEDLVLDGPASITVFAAKHSTLTISPTLRVELGDCAAGETTCALVAAAEVSVNNHIDDDGFESLTLDLGTITRTFETGHILVLQISAPGLISMHIGYDADSHPSLLALTAF